MSNVPWRKSGAKYSNNEIYFDIVEELDSIIDSNGQSVMLEVHGNIEVSQISDPQPTSHRMKTMTLCTG